MSGAAVGAVQIFYYGFVGFAPRLSQLSIQHVRQAQAGGEALPVLYVRNLPAVDPLLAGQSGERLPVLTGAELVGLRPY